MQEHPDKLPSPNLSPQQFSGLILVPSLFFLVAFILTIDSANPLVGRTAGVAIWIAVWWITEPIPIPATSLLPLVHFPLIGVMPGKKVGSVYMNSSIFLFMGGFLIALSLEKWNLHRRIALRILKTLGDRPHRLILGFMIATALLSMWISNTATTMMMLPATLSASCAFMLPVATPPNAIIFGSGRVPIIKMVLTGIVLNVIGVVLVALLVMFVAVPLFGL